MKPSGNNLTIRLRTMIYSNEGNLPLLELCPEGRGRVLDVGCGAGDNARIFQARGWEVTGITIDPGEKEIASQFCDAFVLADLELGLPEEVTGPYDLILFSHVLEHLRYPLAILIQAKKVLAPDGFVAVALPNVLYWKNRLKLFFGNFEYSIAGGLMDIDHLRFYTFASGARLLEAAGYEIVTKKADGNLPLWKLRQLMPGGLVTFLNQLASRFLPGLFGYQCLYLARDEKNRN